MQRGLLFILCSVLLSVCCVQALAQAGYSPDKRLELSLVDNKSTYVVDDEKNNYENILRLNQPEGEYKLTAGMLNEGDNEIVLHRSDDKGHDNEVALINLLSEIIYKPVYAGQIDFYGDGTHLPSSQTTMTQTMLPSNWGTDGSNLVLQTNGCAYITGKGGLTITVPSGFNNDTLQIVAEVGTNIRDGYFSYCLNDGSWYVLSGGVNAGETSILTTLTGINTGDVISLYGGQKDGDSYYSVPSPDIKMIGFHKIAKTLIPTVTVSPTISHWNGSAWGQETSLNGATYSVNDQIDLAGLGTITDAFSESTTDNSHPSSYSYQVDFDANVVLPSGSSTGKDFLASADFTTATTSNASSATFGGENNWSFYGAKVYSPSAGRCCYLLYYGSIMYTMPASFMGNSVQVTITSNNSSDGAGDLYVNGQVHTFTSGETYTWTVPVCANGAIELKCVSDDFSIDFTRIVISSGNGAALNKAVAAQAVLDEQQAKSTPYPFDSVKKVHDSEKMETVK